MKEVRMPRIDPPDLPELLLKGAVLQTATYVLTGLAALVLLDYETLFQTEPWSGWMRPVSDPLVAAGPLVQPLRGALFGLAVWLVRDSVFRERGWLSLWLLFAILGIWNTFAAAPGSIEGAVYTKLPWLAHLWPGQPEVLLQSLLLALGLTWWCGPRRKRWFGIGVSILAVLGLAAAVMGLIAG
jgi:hypothetical protein